MVKPPPKLQGHPYELLLTVVRPDVARQIKAYDVTSNGLAKEAWRIINSATARTFGALDEAEQASRIARERAGLESVYESLEPELIDELCEELAREKVREDIAPGVSLTMLMQVLEAYR